MSLPRRAITFTLATVAGLVAVLAGIYLVVACQSLPSVLGPVAGDTQPRTKLGAITLLFAVVLAIAAVIAARTREDRR